jgi:glutamate dehydrogenase/leucine dehydrogenase
MTVANADSLTRSLGWGHEQVHLLHDQETGLEAVIAIHSTVLGPALGGLRMRTYAGGLPEALDDALRLSRAMTLKAAAAGLDLGGGKAVVLERDGAASRTSRLAGVAREVERLGGAYITAEDVGTTIADMDLVAEHTSYVVGRSESNGLGGDPSPATALTVFGGIRSALEILDGESSLDGRRVGVIGLGKVGAHLCDLLTEEGAEVIGFDPSAAAAGSCRGRIDLAADLEDILSAELDVLAPCAIGGMIDTGTAGDLRCRAVCGAANNPLTGPEVAAALAHRGILYVPDFLANCGGLIHADAERLGEGGGQRLEESLAEAERRTREVLAEALATDRLPAEIAEERAWSRIRAASDSSDVQVG